jgi:serine/threonine-protein kinase
VLDRLKASAELPDASGTKYRLIERIGRGGMGAVYLAEDRDLGRKVAFKVLDVPDLEGELAARLVREARILARLEHPGIVPVHDVGELPDGRLFYTMKYVEGYRLDQFLETPRMLSDRLRAFIRICEAVAFAHDKGVLHRDLKPANIMMGPFGEVLVMDWGVAKVLRTSSSPESADPGEESPVPPAEGKAGPLESTEHGMVLGTPGYMAPEQARGEVDRLDRRADVYSLGAVLRYMVDQSGIDPEATTLARDRRAGRSRSMPRGKISKRLRAIIDKALASEPENRYENAEALARDVESFLDGGSVGALPESIWVKAGRFVSRHRVAVILILVYVVVRALVIILGGR